MTEALKINQFNAHLQKEALQIFRNINASNKTTLGDVLNVFQQKKVKAESQTTAKHKWHQLTFDPKTKSLSEFSDELNGSAEKAFGENAPYKTDSVFYA